MRLIHGIGIGLRPSLVDQVLASPHAAIDWIEVAPENLIGQGRRTDALLDALIDRVPVVPHGLSLSVGGRDPLDRRYLDAVGELVARTGAPFWSDHLCVSAIGGIQAHELLPLTMTPAVADRVARRARTAADHVGAPLLLENVSAYVRLPGSTLDEVAFLTRICDAADCGILLDVNNVLVNAINFGFDPSAFIDAVPIERVQQIHVAGHDRVGGLAIDTHRGPTPDPVWALYRRAIRRAGWLVPTLIEWDTDVPPLARLVEEAARARSEAAVALAEAA